jgi:hypothetical protein
MTVHIFLYSSSPPSSFTSVSKLIYRCCRPPHPLPWSSLLRSSLPRSERWPRPAIFFASVVEASSQSTAHLVLTEGQLQRARRCTSPVPHAVSTGGDADRTPTPSHRPIRHVGATACAASGAGRGQGWRSGQPRSSEVFPPWPRSTARPRGEAPPGKSGEEGRGTPSVRPLLRRHSS